MLKRLFLIGVLLVAGAESALAGIPASAFGRLPSVHDAAISPDGRQVAAYVNIKGRHLIRVMSIDTDDTSPRLIGLPDEIKPLWIRWANDEQILAALWRNEKLDNLPFTSSYIYTFNATTLKGKVLVKPRRVFRQDNSEIVDWLDHDPDHVLMAFSNKSQSIADINKVNVATGKYKRLKRGKASIQNWYTDQRGEPRVGQGISDRSTTEAIYTLEIRDADAEKWRTYKNYPGLNADENIFGFTANPNELIVGRFYNKPTLGLYIYDLNEKAITRELFHDDRYDAQSVVFTRDGGEVAGVTIAADEPEVRLFDGFDSAIRRAEKSFAPATVDYIDSSTDGRRVLMKISNPADPGLLVLWDGASESYSRFSTYRPEMPPEELGNVVSARYLARDGTKIPAYITIPPHITAIADLKGLPFVVLPHGGPYAREYKRFDYFAQFFATRGFAVLQMNFRGSSGFGADYEEAGRSNWSLMHDDIEDGTRWLIDEGYADPDRVCIAGWSFGGYAALVGAFRSPELYQCAISIAGVTDLNDLIRDTRKYRFGRLTANNSVLSGFKDRDEMLSLSPVRHVDDMTIPIFAAHGELDVRVQYDQFKRLRSRLKGGDERNMFIGVEDDHFLSVQDNRQRVFESLDEFLSATVLAGAP
ncbi:MAG: prolyl oligopeptidase family serine peptidase [Pseudomonadota bacterium]